MFALRRWWNQYALKAGLTVLALVAALGLRDVGGVPIYEVYRWVTRPFYPGPSRSTMLQSSYTQGLQQRLIELESQNRSLRRIVEGDTREASAHISAAVIGRSAGDWWQQIIISQGSSRGVSKDDIVIGPGGLVGRVVGVSPNSSRVLLVSDSTSRVGARVSRSRATGYIRGMMDRQVVMEFFDKMPDVEVGDVVVTSAYSQLFPRDVPIGRVVEVNLAKSPAPEVTLELTAALDILEWVEVIPFDPKATDLPKLEEPQPTPSLNSEGSTSDRPQ
ncbi:MAG: rod shape-determining protein MreC [Cyanobacteria bacterium J06638_28]